MPIEPDKAPISRRRFLQSLGVFGGAGAAAVFTDAYYIEPRHLEIGRVDVALPRLGGAWSGLRVAQLSDFHYDTVEDGELIAKAVQLTNTLQPDLVVLTGDFVKFDELHRSPGQAAKADPCARILKHLQAPLGVFAVLGNHDSCDPAFIARQLDSQGIAVLRNHAIPIERSGDRLWIAGVDDALTATPDLAKTFRAIPPGAPTILLAHEPDYADAARSYPVDLQLSGHSHGGQVRLPLIGCPYLPEMGRKYPMGFRKLGSMALYTNRGLGTTFLPARFNAPPEVTLLTLRGAERA